MLKKRTISVPLTVEAEKRLDYDESIDGDLEELDLTEEEFNQFYSSGVIDKLNEELDVIIDDYESEDILLSQLEPAKNIVSDAVNKNPDLSILKEILKLFELAIKKKTSVSFFF